MHPYRDLPETVDPEAPGDDRPVYVGMALIGGALLWAGGPIGLTLGGVLLAVGLVGSARLL